MPTPLLFVFLLFLPTADTQGQTYKWIDESGVVNYSQTPPASFETETLNPHTQPPEVTEAAKQQLDQLKQQLEDRREDRQLAKQAAQKANQEMVVKRSNCAAARSNLRQLESSHNRLMRTAEGEYLRMTEPERRERMREALAQIEANCSR